MKEHEPNLVSGTESVGDRCSVTKRPLQGFVCLLIRGYQAFLSPVFRVLGAECRFYPTCSDYAMVAVRKYGVARGLVRALRRLLRCHPLSPGGFDPP
ncbi:MAG: membrane protein insertion efficiency factor YidD [Deltaproteobacteria bacterium]|nr:membrane protein insertion efficiency factor YidD [Deltaproteobacteria bacterium]